MQSRPYSIVGWSERKELRYDSRMKCKIERESEKERVTLRHRNCRVAE